MSPFDGEAGRRALDRIGAVYAELEELEAAGVVPERVRELLEELEAAAGLMGAVCAALGSGGVGAEPPRGLRH